MGAVDTVKDLAKLVQQLDNIEIVQKVLTLQSDMMELQDHVQALKEENRQLKKQLQQKDELDFKNNMYWRTIGDTQEGPFCTKCFDSEGKIIRLHGDDDRGYKCPECKILTDTDTSRENRKKATEARRNRPPNIKRFSL